MTEIDNRIAKMPAKVAFAVLNLRKVHACIMELPRSKSVQLAKKAAYLNYIEGEGRKLGKVPLHYERLNEKKGESVTVETYFRYLDRIH